MNKSYLLRAVRDTRGAPSAGTVGGIPQDLSGNAVPAVTDAERARRLCLATDTPYTGQSVATAEAAATTALNGVTYQQGGRR